MGYLIWCALCLVLCVYNLWILVEESKLVAFNKINSSFTNEKFSFCLSLRELIEAEVFSEHAVLAPKQIIDRVADQLLAGNEEHLILATSSIRHNHVCLDFVKESFHLIFPNISGYEFKLFINPSNETEIYFFENCLDWTGHNRLESGNFVLSILVTNVRFLPHPFETNCTLTGQDKTIYSRKKVL